MAFDFSQGTIAPTKDTGFDFSKGYSLTSEDLSNAQPYKAPEKREGLLNSPLFRTSYDVFTHPQGMFVGAMESPEAKEFVGTIPERVKTAGVTLYDSTIGRLKDNFNTVAPNLVRAILGKQILDSEDNYVYTPKSYDQRLREVVTQLATGGANTLEMTLGVAYFPLVLGGGFLKPEVTQIVEQTIDNYKTTYNQLEPDTKQKVDAVLSTVNKYVASMPKSLKRMESSLARFALDTMILEYAAKPAQPTIIKDKSGATIELPPRPSTFREWSNEPLSSFAKHYEQEGKQLLDSIVQAPKIMAKGVVRTAQNVIAGAENTIANITTSPDKERAIVELSKRLKALGFTPAKMNKFYDMTGQNPSNWILEHGYYDIDPQVMLKNIEGHFRAQFDIKNQAIEIANLSPKAQHIQDPVVKKALIENYKFFNGANYQYTDYGNKMLNRTVELLTKYQTEGGISFKEVEELKRMFEGVRNLSYSRLEQSVSKEALKSIDTGLRELQLKNGQMLGIPEWQEMNYSIQASKWIINNLWKASYPELVKELENQKIDIIDWIIYSGGHFNPTALSISWLRHNIQDFKNYKIKYWSEGMADKGLIQPNLHGIISEGQKSLQEITRVNIANQLGKGQTNIETLIREIEYDYNLQRAGVEGGRFRQLSFDDIPMIMDEAKSLHYTVKESSLRDAIQQQLDDIEQQATIITQMGNKPSGYQFNIEEMPNPPASYPSSTTIQQAPIKASPKPKVSTSKTTPSKAPTKPVINQPTSPTDIKLGEGLKPQNRSLNPFGKETFYEDKTIGLHGEGATAPQLPQRLAGLQKGDYVMVGREPAQVIGGTNAGLKVKFLSDDSVDIVTNFDRVSKASKADISLEVLSENAGGWSKGTKTRFDTALRAKNAKVVQELLPQVPKDYATRFAKEIKSLTKFDMDDAQIVKAIDDIKSGGTTYIKGEGFLGQGDSLSVAPYPQRSVVTSSAPTTDSLADFIEKNADLLGQKNHGLGGWYDKASNQTYMDVAVKFPTILEKEAIELAKLQNQKSVFDFRNFMEIPTGGTGKMIEGIMGESEVLKYLANLF